MSVLNQVELQKELLKLSYSKDLNFTDKFGLWTMEIECNTHGKKLE